MDFEKRLDSIMNNFKLTKTAAKEEEKTENKSVPQDETNRLVAAPNASDNKTDSLVEEIEEALAGFDLENPDEKEAAEEKKEQNSASNEIEQKEPVAEGENKKDAAQEMEEEETEEESEEEETEEESEEEETEEEMTSKEAACTKKKVAALVSQGIAKADLMLEKRFQMIDEI